MCCDLGISARNQKVLETDTGSLSLRIIERICVEYGLTVAQVMAYVDNIANHDNNTKKNIINKNKCINIIDSLSTDTSLDNIDDDDNDLLDDTNNIDDDDRDLLANIDDDIDLLDEKQEE